MGLWQKNPYESHDSKSLYTLGLNKTLLIVGLGNIGKKYEGTRHNVGFEAVEAFRQSHKLDDWHEKKDLKCSLTSGTIVDKRVILAKPTTYMNASGEAIGALARFYKVGLADILVIHDELDINFGVIRTRKGGGSAGNNGIKSIITHLGEDFNRLRVGVGPVPPKMDGADFVLGKFNLEEKKQLDNLNKEAVALMTEYVASDSLPSDTRSFIVG